MPPSNPKPHRTQPSTTPEVVDPLWLIKAIGLVLVSAFVCGYLTFCIFFYLGQWQLVLHPVRTKAAPASIAGAPYSLIRFATDDSGTPQLTGWHIPAAPGSRYANTTILFLPPADGSLADSIPTLATLHALGINIFAFDYRGYGQSAAVHPSQQNLLQDAESAWNYLTATRSIPASQIVPYGTGIGATLATHLAANHPGSPALILDGPQSDLLDSVRKDSRTALLPVRLLFRERFPLAEPLSTLRTPKLLLYRTTTPPAAFHTAAAPKFTADLTNAPDALYQQTLSRFLDQNLTLPPSQRVPTPTP